MFNKLFNNLRKKYYVDRFDNGQYVVVKILNQYDTEEEAEKDLIKLGTRKTTEKELLKEFSNK
jgi:3-deoxy-D-arabino-heptulosonate 7-phosphate (DAHP) synthase